MNGPFRQATKRRLMHSLLAVERQIRQTDFNRGVSFCQARGFAASHAPISTFNPHCFTSGSTGSSSRCNDNRLFSTKAAPSEPPASSTSGSTGSDQNNPNGVNMKELMELASQRCTPLKLVDMYKYAIDFNNSEQRSRNAQFLYREMPIRVAQRAVDLLTLPHGLSDSLPIQQVAHVYLRYLQKFKEIQEPKTEKEEEQFTDMLQGMILDRTSIPTAIAQGVAEWRAKETTGGLDSERMQEMEEALYRFFTARVGLRFLTEHHILSSPTRIKTEIRRNQTYLADDDDEFFLGCIMTNCCPTREIRKVVKHVSQQTKDYYGMCPEIEIFSTKMEEAPFTYVPHHLHYMAGELIKNSCRATVKRHLDSIATGKKEELHPIKVVIAKGIENVTIKVADRGGGIPRSSIEHIWKFAHSTAGEDEGLSDFGVDQVTGSKIRGFGLPLARIYARYLGGELTLKSMEGYGLDAYMYLPRLGENCENLPRTVLKSPSMDISLPPSGSVAAATTTRN